MSAKVLEIFSSIQGEGRYAGVKQVFVRFFECNMHCVWCDTPHSIGDTTRHYKEYDIERLLKEVEEMWTPAHHSVSLTGGEPLLQADVIQELIPHFQRAGRKVYLETNGVLPDALSRVIAGVDVVAMDIKLPSSTQCQAYWQEHEAFLKVALQKEVFIKAVISSATQAGDVEQAAQLVARLDPSILFILQPNYFEMKNGAMQKCQEFHNSCQKYLEDVRIIPQIHKFMKVR